MSDPRPNGPEPRPEPFGTAPDGSPVLLVRLENGGTRAAVMTWGASLQDLRIEGVDHSLVLGGPNFGPYLGLMRYFGAIVGPVANRIARGRAPLGGRYLQFERNEGGRTTLHGGTHGTGRRNWTLDGHGPAACQMSVTVPDGTGGFPGPLTLVARYRLDPDGALVLEIEGRTEAPTFCNPAHHSYWSLDGRGDLTGHELCVHAARYLAVDAEKIPRGAPVGVAGTVFDFRKPRCVTCPESPPLDHNFCLADAPSRTLQPACTLRAGRVTLEVATTEPGLQVYDGAGIATAPVPGHGGLPYGAHAGLALEPQRWPDAPNHAGYPSILLEPGQTYSQVSRFHARLTRPDET